MEFSNDESNSQTNPRTKRRMVCLVSHIFHVIVDTITQWLSDDLIIVSFGYQVAP